MDRQAGFLLALLFLANFLTIQADGLSDHVSYIGRTQSKVGKSWYIICDNLMKTDKVEWTRDGISLNQEIENKELSLTVNTTASTISSASAKTSHQGKYKCTSDSQFSHDLQIFSGSTSDQSSALSAATEIQNDNIGYYVLDSKKNLTLVCNASSSAPVYWQHGKNNVTDDKKHHALDKNGRDLMLFSPVESIFGNYTCRQNFSAVEPLTLYRVISVPSAKLPPNSSVVEGEKLNLVCQPPAYLGPIISWTFGNETYKESKDRVKLSRDEEHGIDNAVLTVENINMTDEGFIYCHVSFKNIIGNADVHVFTQLTVKDKLAALWPFLGICIEVIVLCAIILVYEKKRNKAELDESDTDQSPDTKPTPNKDSEVRHRK